MFISIDTKYERVYASNGHRSACNTADTDVDPLTCATENHAIERSITPQHISECRDKCDKNRKCEYFSYNTNTWCILYDGCDTIRNTTGTGTKITYKKIRGKTAIFGSFWLCDYMRLKLLYTRHCSV